MFASLNVKRGRLTVNHQKEDWLIAQLADRTMLANMLPPMNFKGTNGAGTNDCEGKFPTI